jgi:serine/threonine protein kinase
MAGTPEFVAPEVVNYEFISSQTDMWAVGVRQPGHLNTSSVYVVK